MHGHEIPRDIDMDMPVPEGVGEAEFRTFQQIKRSTVLQRHLMMRALAGRGAHPGQAAALWVLSRKQGISQRDLAERLHVTPPAVTGILQKMERAGLVERTTDAADQRMTRIAMTGEGKKLAHKLHGVFGGEITAMFAGLSEQEIAQLNRLMQAVNENMARSLRETETTEGA